MFPHVLSHHPEVSMIRQVLCVLCLSVLIAGTTIADHHMKSGAFQNDMLGQIAYVEKQIMSLEEAVPQEKYSWRPAEGVRSVGEVYNHIAFGNYALLKFAGIEPPAEVGWSMDFKAWDEAVQDKKEIAARLQASFDHLRAGVKGTSDADLEKEVEFFGQKMTVRNMMMSALSHLHEHLGQSIAYARSNGIVPPWTAEQNAQAEEMQKKKDGKKY